MTIEQIESLIEDVHKEFEAAKNDAVSFENSIAEIKGYLKDAIDRMTRAQGGYAALTKARDLIIASKPEGEAV